MSEQAAWGRKVQIDTLISIARDLNEQYIQTGDEALREKASIVWAAVNTIEQASNLATLIRLLTDEANA